MCVLGSGTWIGAQRHNRARLHKSSASLSVCERTGTVWAGCDIPLTCVCGMRLAGAHVMRSCPNHRYSSSIVLQGLEESRRRLGAWCLLSLWAARRLPAFGAVLGLASRCWPLVGRRVCCVCRGRLVSCCGGRLFEKTRRQAWAALGSLVGGALGARARAFLGFC